jgi:hypothetical protein
VKIRSSSLRLPKWVFSGGGGGGGVAGFGGGGGGGVAVLEVLKCRATFRLIDAVVDLPKLRRLLMATSITKTKERKLFDQIQDPGNSGNLKY